MSSGYPVRLAALAADLPADLETMRAEARAEGHRFLERLTDDWQRGTMRFDRTGEALLAAYCDGSLAGIGGLTIDPAIAGALRMRRFYIRAALRRHGIGRLLATQLLDAPRRAGQLVIVNAAPDSFRFWEALGFAPDARDGHTHILQGGKASSIGLREPSLEDQPSASSRG